MFNKSIKTFNCVLATLLTVVSLSLFCTSCKLRSDTAGNNDVVAPPSSSENTTVKELGTGATSFGLTVADLDNNEKKFTIKTDEKTVGAALLKVGLIEGTDGQYGLYINKVDGVAADFDKDKTYWAFYINGEYASTGVDKTDITADAEYKLQISK